MLSTVLNKLLRSGLKAESFRFGGSTPPEELARRWRAVVRKPGVKQAAIRSIAPIAVSFSIVALMTAVLFVVESYLEAQHLVIAYLFPTTLVAIRYGSSFAFLTSFASGIAAAYFLFPPRFSLYIAETLHVAELGFFLLLALLASKVVSLLAHDIRASRCS